MISWLHGFGPEAEHHGRRMRWRETVQLMAIRKEERECTHEWKGLVPDTPFQARPSNLLHPGRPCLLQYAMEVLVH